MRAALKLRLRRTLAEPPSSGTRRSHGQVRPWPILIAAITLAFAIFALDSLSPLQGAVAVLYTTVILIAAKSQRRRMVIVATALSLILALSGYAIMHWSAPLGSPTIRLSVSLIAIGIAAFLSIQHLDAANERKRSDDRYRAIFNAAGLAIWEADWSAAYRAIEAGEAIDVDLVIRASSHMRVLNANEAAARLFGRAASADLIGEHADRHHTPSCQKALVRIFAALSRGDTDIEEEAHLQRPSGEMVDVVLRVTLPPGQAGWRHVLVMAIDMSERNRTQARLTQAQADLAHVSRLTTLGELAASIAHEVNQPLSAIITYAQSGRRWLEREAPEAAEVADCLDHIVSNGNRAAEVIARIRNFARKSEPRHTEVDIGRLADETVALLHHDLQARKIELHRSIPAERNIVVGDRVQLQQVLMNLLLNAEQAMADVPEDDRELGISIVREETHVLIEVRDSGPGLGSVDPERLFKPFYTTKGDGLGMGLAISRSIVEHHVGSLTAAASDRGGAIFRFRLPVIETEEQVSA